jgi:hypothetical protein
MFQDAAHQHQVGRDGAGVDAAGSRVGVVDADPGQAEPVDDHGVVVATRRVSGVREP